MDHNWGYGATMLASLRHAELIAQAEHYRRLHELEPVPRPRRWHPWRRLRRSVAAALRPRPASAAASCPDSAVAPGRLA
ncbi:hypothetical protein MF406_12460 [Georgenia sp. TF02-10]|uniref:hypothetical protein n=1 Tax=Georgenia sp. TF02-10 TaxID=2917725 RepID=UPI001FA7746C|nr:hypothetical protein [Georgenia sp. TF02-10]UNX53788.1 hypothetical protein MF406_12460 [Georgenia sp. TF02-10]